jgi:hypothetical protein
LKRPLFMGNYVHVAMLHARCSNNVKIFIKKTADQGTIFNDSRVLTQNIVYPVIFSDYQYNLLINENHVLSVLLVSNFLISYFLVNKSLWLPFVCEFIIFDLLTH